MNDEAKRDAEAGENWPPPLMSQPPAPVPKNLSYPGLPLWQFALIDMGLGLAAGLVYSLLSRMTHQPLRWGAIAWEGAVVFSVLFVFHLWVRHHHLKKQKLLKRQNL